MPMVNDSYSLRCSAVKSGLSSETVTVFRPTELVAMFSIALSQDYSLTQQTVVLTSTVTVFFDHNELFAPQEHTLIESQTDAFAEHVDESVLTSFRLSKEVSYK